MRKAKLKRRGSWFCCSGNDTPPPASLKVVFLKEASYRDTEYCVQNIDPQRAGCMGQFPPLSVGKASANSCVAEPRQSPCVFNAATHHQDKAWGKPRRKGIFQQCGYLLSPSHWRRVLFCISRASPRAVALGRAWRLPCDDTASWLLEGIPDTAV